MNVNSIDNFNQENQNVVKHSYLTDDVIDYFQELTTAYTNYKPYHMWQTLLPAIEKIPRTRKHLQILFSSSSSGNVYDVGHWVCSFYDTESIFIFDSLNRKQIHNDHEKVLKALHPYYFEEGKTIVFPNVQRQTNSKDCGVFAIAFAVSLLFGIKPNLVSYKTNLMRPHLLKMLVNKCIEHFPCDLQRVSVTEFPRSIYNEQIIIDNACLNDLHIDYFHKLLEKVSLYKPCSTLYLQNISRIDEIPEDNKHIQILFQRGSNIGHWICTFYDTTNLIVYDSLNSKTLSEDFVKVLRRLHPYCFNGKKTILFPTVQSQHNVTDCGVFAIAFAVSVLFGHKPEEIIYHQNKMRSHLINIFQIRSIKQFPCSYNNNLANSDHMKFLQYHYTNNYKSNDNNFLPITNRNSSKLKISSAVDNPNEKVNCKNKNLKIIQKINNQVMSLKPTNEISVSSSSNVDNNNYKSGSSNKTTESNVISTKKRKITLSVEACKDYKRNEKQVLEEREIHYIQTKSSIIQKNKNLKTVSKIDICKSKLNNDTSTISSLNINNLESNCQEYHVLNDRSSSNEILMQSNLSPSLLSGTIKNQLKEELFDKKVKISLKNRKNYERNKKKILEKRKINYDTFKNKITNYKKLCC